MNTATGSGQHARPTRVCDQEPDNGRGARNAPSRQGELAKGAA